MQQIFPLDVKAIKVRGLVKMLKEHSKMKISELAKESNEDIDELLPLIEASELLGLCMIEDSSIMITEKGKKTSSKDFHSMVEAEIRAVEPFKTILKLLKQYGELTTEELVEKLDEKGVIPYRDEMKKVQMKLIKEALFNWALRNSIIEHNHKKDTWKSIN